MADLPPPPDPAAVQAMMDAKTPHEAAMARVKMSSQEIWELYQQAEEFNKQDAVLELEMKNAWKDAKDKSTSGGGEEAPHDARRPQPRQPAAATGTRTCRPASIVRPVVEAQARARRRRHRMKEPRTCLRAN